MFLELVPVHEPVDWMLRLDLMSDAVEEVARLVKTAAAKEAILPFAWVGAVAVTESTFEPPPSLSIPTGPWL